MTFEEWWPQPKCSMPPWFESLRAGFRACWMQSAEEATRAERERCAARCDELAARWNSYGHIGTDMGNWYFAGKAVGGELCAIAVRDQEADDD